MSSTVVLVPLQMPDEDEPVSRWSTTLTANEGAGPNARLRVRTQLRMAKWNGNVDIASRVADKLMDNAASHGQPFADGSVVLRLTVLPETEELLIEADDADPKFPDFQAAAANAPTGRGLWWVDHYHGRLDWHVKRDDEGQVIGKTVQVVLPPNGS
ncbi:hypothetical protein [Streptomyces sp. NPDC001139]